MSIKFYLFTLALFGGFASELIAKEPNKHIAKSKSNRQISTKEKVRNLKKLADKYDDGAIRVLGNLASIGNIESFEYLIKRAIDSNTAQICLEEIAKNGNSKTIARFTKHAEKGNPVCQYVLGQLYHKGSKSIKRNSKLAFVCYKHAAEQGYIPSYIALKTLAIEGSSEALNWLKYATSKGCYDAIHQITSIAEDTENADVIHFLKENSTYTALLSLERIAEKGNVNAINAIKELAENGNAIGQHIFGNLYRKGIRGKIDANERIAFKWYKKSAQQDHLEVFHELMWLIRDNKNLNAFKLLEELSNSGIPNAQYTLGGLYDDGIYVKQDGKKAFELYKKSAKQNNVSATGAIISLANGGNNEVFDFLKKLTGNAIAQGYLAEQYSLGIMVKKDEKQAFSLHKQAIENGDNVRFETLTYLPKNGFTAPFEYIKTHATNGNSYAQLALASIYKKGINGVVKKNHKQAFYWYKMVVDKGEFINSKIALSAIGELAEAGNIEAIKWLKERWKSQ